jgi:YNFM family putative membrane transporter
MPEGLIEPGTARFWRTNLALFAAGLATFALLYAVQPLLPVFAAAFRVSPAVSSLTLSLTTLPLAFAMLGASLLADRFGRKPVMVASLLASAGLGTVCAVAPGLGTLLVLRVLMGISLAGLPSVCMTYISEEMAPAATGLAIGLFIGGSALGGMSGRLLAGWIAAQGNWRAALGTIGLISVACGVVLARALPAGRMGLRSTSAPGFASFSVHLRDPTMRRLFTEGFCLMGGFVTVYNYIAFRLLAPPLSLSAGQVSLIFGVYLVGVVSSGAVGQAAVRFGRRPALLASIVVMLAGLLLTLVPSVGATVAGMAAFTGGFFGAHSVASAWVGAAARLHRAQASALYLLAYYAGSSVAGTVGGLIWARFAWPGIAGAVAALLMLAAWRGGELPRRG